MPPFFFTLPAVQVVGVYSLVSWLKCNIVSPSPPTLPPHEHLLCAVVYLQNPVHDRHMTGLVVHHSLSNIDQKPEVKVKGHLKNNRQ